MSTVRDIVKDSMKKIGVLAPGETPSADELSDAIRALRNMLDSWSNDGFNVPSRVREEFNLVAGQGSYTIGTGGNFNTARPIEVEQVRYMDNSSLPAIERDVTLLNTEEWANILQKDLQGLPDKMYRAGTYPLDTLYFYPVPDSAKKVVLYSRKKLLSITNANTEIELPEGYERAIIYNLAVELAPDYGKSVPVEVGTVAIDSKAAVMRLNGEPNYLETSAVLVGGKFFNIITGDST